MDTALADMRRHRWERGIGPQQRARSGGLRPAGAGMPLAAAGVVNDADKSVLYSTISTAMLAEEFFLETAHGATRPSLG